MNRNYDYSDLFGPQHHELAYAVRLDWGDIMVSQAAHDAYELSPHWPMSDPKMLEQKYTADVSAAWGAERHNVFILGPSEQLALHQDNWSKGSWSLSMPNGEPFSVSVSAAESLDNIVRSLVNHRARQSSAPPAIIDPDTWDQVRNNVRRGLPGELGRKAAELAAGAYVVTEHKRAVAQQANVHKAPLISYSLGASALESAGLAFANTSPYALPALSIGAAMVGITGLQHIARRTARSHKAITDAMLGKPVEGEMLAARIRADFLRVFEPDLYNQHAETILGRQGF